LEEIAERELRSVGDAQLGEWRARERGDAVFHLRRRLTAKEAEDGRIVDVIDIRGTEDFTQRIGRMRRFLPPQMREWPDEVFP